MSESEPNETRELLVDAQSVSVQFQSQWILREVNLRIPRGQTLSIIGESGCGKTVLMKTLVGLIRPTGGQVIFDGQDLVSIGPAELAKLRRRFGFVFQNAACSTACRSLTTSRFHSTT